MQRSRTFWYALVSISGLVGFTLIVSILFGHLFEGSPGSNSAAKELDRSVFFFFKQFRSEPLNSIVEDITSLGSFTVLTWFGIGLAAFLILLHQRSRLAELMVVGAGAALWPRILKVHFGRARPDLADRLVSVSEYSFPSGHAFGSSAMYFAFGLLAAEVVRGRGQKSFCIGFSALTVLMVGLSRIYLGVHYTTDVLAGFCLGTAWTFFVALMFDLNRKRLETRLANRSTAVIVTPPE